MFRRIFFSILAAVVAVTIWQAALRFWRCFNAPHEYYVVMLGQLTDGSTITATSFVSAQGLSERALREAVAGATNGVGNVKFLSVINVIRLDPR